MALKLSVPLVLDFSVHQAPLMWSSFLSWLKPPYLYVIINGIIITIAASSLFHKDHHGAQPEPESTPPAKVEAHLGYEMSTPAADTQREFGGLELPVVVYEQREEARGLEEEEHVEEVVKTVAIEDGDHDDDFLVTDSMWSPLKKMDSLEYSPAEKPLVSARFGHRKPVKSSPEGARVLRVSRPKRHETLENTWKTITEGRAMPLTRHLKKSDTWENQGRHITVDSLDPPPVKKSETFKDRTNYQQSPVTPSPTKLRKEPSLSQDELNRRVEAFIKKFNEEMRLQRQESLNQYKEMINGGL